MPTAEFTSSDLRGDLRLSGEGDLAAFRRVYEATAAKLLGICLRITGDRASAEDVLHEVYITVWRKAAMFDGQRGSPITWLAMIARNRAIDWKRAQGRHVDRFGAMLPPFVADEAVPLDQLVEAAELEAMAMRCLDELNDDQRGPIREAFLDGLTYATIAERLHVPLATIKSRIRRGLIQLKKCLHHG